MTAAGHPLSSVLHQSCIFEGPMVSIHAESAVIDPVVKAHIQHQLGFSFEQADPAAVAFVIDRSRHAGNQAFKDKRYTGALSADIYFKMQKLILSPFATF